MCILEIIVQQPTWSELSRLSTRRLAIADKLAHVAHQQSFHYLVFGCLWHALLRKHGCMKHLKRAKTIRANAHACPITRVSFLYIYIIKHFFCMPARITLSRMKKNIVRSSRSHPIVSCPPSRQQPGGFTSFAIQRAAYTLYSLAIPASSAGWCRAKDR